MYRGYQKAKDRTRRSKLSTIISTNQHHSVNPRHIRKMNKMVDVVFKRSTRKMSIRKVVDKSCPICGKIHSHS